MKNENETDSLNHLSWAILFAAVIIAGSIIYLASQLSGGVTFSTSPNQPSPQVVAAPAPSAPAAPLAPTARVSGNFTDDDPALGDKRAPVTLIEFSDFQCPFCERFFSQTFSQIKAKYIDTGKVRFVFRDFPLAFHPFARPAAMAANCAREQDGDRGYFAYHDKIFQNQSSLSLENLKQWATDLKLDTDDFNSCLDSEKYGKEVDQDLADGSKAGISGTPGFLLNGLLISGAQPFAAFEAAIEKELNQ